MNKDQIRGKWEALKGKFKRHYGETTADRKTQATGAVEEGAGKVQSGYGDLKENIREGMRGEPDTKHTTP